MTISPILAQFANEPCLLAPDGVPRFEANLAALAAHADFSRLEQERASDDGFWGEPGSFRAMLRPYIVKDGILQIPVKGVLLHEFPFAFFDLATGYEYIWRAFERGCEDFKDGNIKGIAFVGNSPGGMVAGCFDAVDKMVALKEESKVPVRGFAHEAAYSAAYAILGGVSDHIAVSRTGGVGSIGVLTMHLDVSAAMEQRGFRITYIFAGKHKVDGNPYEALPDEVKARIQARIDELYQVFVSAVARGRGMDEQAVRDTEALTFTATQAVSNGLADSIGSLDDAVAAFAADLSSTSGDEEMADPVNVAAADQAAVDSARAEGRAEGERNRDEAVATARQAERQRVAAIMGCEEAEGRQTLANHIAMNTEMSLEDAKAMLAAAPKEAKEESSTTTPFDAAMGGTENPDVGAEHAQGDKDKELADPVALARAVGLAGVRPAPAN